MIRFLNLTDVKDCTFIASLKNRTAGTVPLNPKDFYSAYEKYFSNNEEYKAIGYFEEDELISFLFISLFENKMRGKFWVVSGLYTKEFKNNFSFKTAGFGELMKFAFSYTESKGWYEYYYCTAERIMNVYERQWRKNNIMPNGRYELILLDRVPPNTEPGYELYWKLMGSSVKPDTMVFKKRVLKPEFRIVK